MPLDNLIYIKKIIIVKINLITIIFKLRPNNYFNPKLYIDIQRPIILLL